MRRRWTIRICFMLPILLCAYGWVWSGTHCATASHCTGDEDNHVYCLEMDGGGFWVEVWRPDHGQRPSNWDWRVRSPVLITEAPDGLQPQYWPSVPENTSLRRFFYARFDDGSETCTSILGFELDRYSAGREWFRFFLPFWFFIAVFSAVLFLVRRNTRPKMNPKMAFPVIVGEPHA